MGEKKVHPEKTEGSTDEGVASLQTNAREGSDK